MDESTDVSQSRDWKKIGGYILIGYILTDLLLLLFNIISHQRNVDEWFTTGFFWSSIAASNIEKEETLFSINSE